MDEFSKENKELSPLQAEQLIEESEARFNLLIDSVKDYAIFMLDPQGYIKTWNTGAQKIKGYSKEEIINRHFSKFYPEESKAASFPQFELTKALEEGRFEDEGWRIRKDRTLFWANVVITPIFNHENRHIGFTKITRDLSERVRNENLMKKNLELLRVNTDLDNFIYTASHDLKSPIANLEGLVNLMEKKISPKLDEPERQILRLMENSIHKLNNTIGSLIEVTKAQKDLDAKAEVISLEEVLQDVMEELSSEISDTGAEIQTDFEFREISFPKGGLRSIMFNLLSNAIKYHSPERKPVILIRSYKEGKKIVLSIQDNGLGFPKTQEAKVFTMFKRFHSHVAGTGIGLYIVKRTMENYGGKIKVHSKINEGTEFKLYFNPSGNFGAPFSR